MKKPWELYGVTKKQWEAIRADFHAEVRIRHIQSVSGLSVEERELAVQEYMTKYRSRIKSS